MFFNKLAQITMENYARVIIEKKEEVISIPVTFRVGFFTYEYTIIISKCELDNSWYDVFYKAHLAKMPVGKIKEGSSEEEIIYTLKDIIQELNHTAMRMTKIDFDLWVDPLKKPDKPKYLYCIMDSTSSTESPGWDVEVFEDTPEARKAWIDSEVGTDSETLRNYFSKKLSCFSMSSVVDAKAYIKELEDDYNMSNLTEIKQKNQ